MVRGLKGVPRFLFELLDRGTASGIQNIAEAENERAAETVIFGRNGSAADLQEKWFDQPREVSKESVFRAYEFYCDSVGDKHQRLPESAFWKEMKRALSCDVGAGVSEEVGFEDFRPRSDGTRQRCIRFKKLGELRSIFECQTGSGPEIWS